MMQHLGLLLCLAPSEGGLLAVDQGDLVAADAAAWDLAAEAVALDGDTALVGARWSDSAGADSGAAYVFTRSGASWSTGPKLVASDAAAADEFGSALALDGSTAAVGSPFADVTGQNEGAVYVFVESGGAWTEQAKLTASDLADADRFGSSVALEADTLLVGATGDDDGGSWSGSVYVFTRTAGVWTERVKLTASDASTNAYFGSALALQSPTAVIGAPGGAGGAYVFIGSGAVWTEQAKLVDSSPASGDRFGEALALSGDLVAVGSPLDDNNGLDAGSVVLYDRFGGAWPQVARLVAGEQLGELGRAVALGPGRCAVGAPRDRLFTSSPLGAVYVFEESGGVWTQAVVFGAATPAALDDFGAALALDADTCLVGVPSADPSATNCGMAVPHELVPGMSRFCFGDGTSASCPCGNGVLEPTGCANSTGAGALLVPVGTPSLAADDLLLQATGLVPSQPALLFGGLNAVQAGSGVAFGDGLRCAGGGVVRLGVKSPDAAGQASWGPGVASLHGVSAGEVRRYQAWYRDPLGTPCGAGFNLSNGVEATFVP